MNRFRDFFRSRVTKSGQRGFHKHSRCRDVARIGTMPAA